MNEIKYFNDFWKPCVEAFESPSKITWIVNNTNNLYGEFYINTDRYEINCDEWGDDIWTYKFYYDENGSKTSELLNKDENKFKTLSTIREGMIFLLDNKKTNGIIINIMDQSTGREYVWERFSKEVSKKYKFDYVKTELLGVKVLMLWRNITFDKMNNAFTLMSRNFLN
jgi:hypothetical protein